jgi:DNA repair exonuclease SbcCD nuclease subunit
MRIAILSDFHLGYGWGTELEKDSFLHAEEAIKKSLDSDLILVCGDIFDSRVPRTDVWAEAMHILSRALLTENKGIKLVKTINKNLKEISKRSLRGIPIVAVHGTHERRGKGLINAVEALEHAGMLIYLHCNSIIFEKDGEKVAIHGMSGVPERYAKDVLEKWNPKPIEGCFNILVLHQSIEPYVYSPLEPPSLNLSNLPRGFDMIIDGHIHIANQIKLDGTTLLFPGSTIVTQMKKEEALNPKGFYIAEIKDKKLVTNFVKLENMRRFFYEEITLDDTKPIRDQLEAKINSILAAEYEKKPLVRLKILGKESSIIDKEIKSIEKKYSEKTILRIVKELETPEITEKMEFLRNLREKKLSVEEMGLRVLTNNLKELGFEEIFEPDYVLKLLMEGEIERTMNILLGEQLTLRPVLEKSKEELQSKAGEEKKTPRKFKKTGLGRWL